MTWEGFTVASMLEMVQLCHKTRSRGCKVLLLDFVNANIVGSVRYSIVLYASAVDSQYSVNINGDHISLLPYVA